MHPLHHIGDPESRDFQSRVVIPRQLEAYFEEEMGVTGPQRRSGMGWNPHLVTVPQLDVLVHL